MTYSLALVLSSIDSLIPTICVVQNFGNERWLVPSLFKFTITSQGLKLKIVFGCIRGCSATQSQAEKGRDSIPPIEDEHQQFRPVFSCNPILSAVKQNLWYGWCTFNYQTRIWDSYPWGCYFSNIPTWQMSPSFRFEMVDLFYDGTAHSSSYPPTHWTMASFPFSRVIISASSWDATGNYFQLPLPAVAQGSSDMKFSFSKILNSPVCACCNKFKCQRTNTLIIHHFEDDVK